MKSIFTVAKNCYLETVSTGEYTSKYSGYATFTSFDGKQYRRRLQDKKLYNEYRYVVRFNNELLVLPFNLQSKLNKDL
jgi:hypothetical protein